MQPLNLLIAANGTKALTGVGAIAVQLDAVIGNSSMIIASIKDQNGVVIADYTGFPLADRLFIRPTPAEGFFSEITLTSGSGVGIRS